MPKALVDGVIVEVSQEEVDLTVSTTEDHKISTCRRKRDNLLAETDWWAVSDRTMTQAEIDYRQALRDVPAQAGFPDNVTWPTKPE